MTSTHDRAQEDHLRDVDRVLLYISQARVKAEEIAEALAKDGAEERLVSALRTAAGAMAAEHKRLMNSTFYIVPAEQGRMEVDEDDAEQDQLAV
jgi:hypothetical protein